MSQDDLVWPTPLARPDREGLSGNDRRRRQWRRSSHGLYVPSDTGVDWSQRIMEVSARLGDPAGAVTGWASLFLQGAHYLSPPLGTSWPIVLVSPNRQLRGGDGWRGCRAELPITEITTVAGVRVTTAERAAFDEMRGLRRLTAAVLVLDMAAQTGLLSVSSFTRYLRTLRGLRGLTIAREAARLASDKSESPMETVMRLELIDAGCGPFLVNSSIYDLTGRFVGRPDLLEPHLGIAVEYDGAYHFTGAQRARDNEREHAFRSLGLEYVAFVGDDFRQPRRVARRFAEVAERATRSQGKRGWTLHQSRRECANDAI